MIEKNWFIFKGDHHLGPFTFNEILNKVKLSEVKNEELLWREGDSDWKAVFNQEEIVSALQKEREASNQARKKLENQTRESQRREFAAKVEKEREHEIKNDEGNIRAIALEKQKQRQLILEQEAARKEAAIAEALQTQRLEAKKKSEEALLKRAALSRPENHSISDGPPPLPPIPNAPDETIIQEEDTESFKQEVLQEIVREKEHRSFDEEQREVQEEHEIHEIQENVQELKGKSFYSSIALVVIVFVFSLFSYDHLFKTSRSLAGLSKRDKDSLRNLSSKPFSGTALHKLRPTADLNSLWLGSNFPNEAAVYLRMESMKGRVLGKGNVIIQASSRFQGQAAHFKELEVIEGEGLIPGEYLYEIKGFQTGLMKNLRKGLGSFPLFKELKAFKAERSQFSFKGTILVAASSLKKFNSLLEKKKSSIEKRVLRPLKDRRQRLKTFMDLLDQVESIYINILGRITKGKSMHLFEKRYNKEVGPYLRDLIIDTNKVHISIMNLDPKESKAYEEVMNFGKDVGHIASEMVTKTRVIRRLGKAKTEVMKERFRIIVEELRQKGRVQVRAMNGIINEHEESLIKAN